MPEYAEWEIIKPLGEGGQSTVYLVRSPGRAAEREKCLQDIRASLDGGKMALLAMSSYSYARPELPNELGALKVFKVPIADADAQSQEATRRLKNEILALAKFREGLPKMLAASEEGHWIVTEFFPEGTLERHIEKFKGKTILALRAFRSLVKTVASLHEEKLVHRDIKPANVFVRSDEKLVLGDFGIVFMPSVADRLTMTNERVGPRDYMPQWGDLGERLELVHTSFDVYMLGKLLWCMVAGKMKLPREYHRRPGFNLEVLFPNDAAMLHINQLLDQCLVEEPDACLASAEELLSRVDSVITKLVYGAPMADESDNLVLPCRVCGRGFYRNMPAGMAVRLQGVDRQNRPSEMLLRVFVCDVCSHNEFFAPNYPEEAAKNGWKPWLKREM